MVGALQPGAQVGGAAEVRDRLPGLPEVLVGVADGPADGGLDLRLVLEPFPDAGGGPVERLANGQVGVRRELVAGLGLAPRLAQQVRQGELGDAVGDPGRALGHRLTLPGVGLGRLGAEAFLGLGFGPLGLGLPRPLGPDHAPGRADHAADQQHEDGGRRQYRPAVPPQELPAAVGR